MNIKQAKEEIKNTVLAYLLKDGTGEYKIPVIRQRPAGNRKNPDYGTDCQGV